MYILTIEMLKLAIIVAFTSIFVAVSDVTATSCNVTANAPSGSIQSPNYPESYLNNLNCYYTITTTPNTEVNLQIVYFNVETNYDYVKIYDGPTVNSPLLGSYTGQTSGNIVNCTTNQALVYFHTDSSIVYNGFNITFWERVTCGEDISATYGTIVSPGYPALPSPNNLDCYYRITTSTGTRVAYDIVYMNLERNYDYVSVYDGPSTSSALIARYTGNQTGVTNRTSTNQVTFYFHTDSSVQSRGFDIYFRHADATNCPATNYTANSGRITSPNHPNNYPNNADCSYHITTDSSTQITLFVRFINIEWTDHCDKDYLEIFDGPTTSSRRLARICGSGAGQVAPIVSSTNTVFARFHSDGATRGTGFEMDYSTSTCPTPLNISGTQGTISSQGYPLSNYADFANCQYYVTTSNGSQALFHVDYLKLEYGSSSCPFDYLRIYDGHDASSPLIANLCGYINGTNYQSSSNKARIEFRTDGSVQFPGFSIIYTSVFNRGEL